MKNALHSVTAGVIILALALGMAWLFAWSLNEDVKHESDIDTLGIITAILQGDKKECRLIDNWPEAPVVMLEAAQKYDIDPYILPCISRAEGPTPAMLNACNVYGLEQRGKLIGFIDHRYSTEAAAGILAKHKGRYQSNGLVDIDTLAVIWCPVNAEHWAKNVKNIYLKSLK